MKTMQDKGSYVAMESAVCPICGITHSHGCGILLDQRLRNSFPEHGTVTTHYGLCEEHSKQAETHIAMIGVDEKKSNMGSDNKIKMEDAYRTGKLAWVKREIFPQIFNTPVNPKQQFVFCQDEVIDHLQKMQVNG